MSANEVKTVAAAPDETEDAVVPKAEEAAAVSPSMGSAVLTGFGWKVATVLVSDVTRIAVAVVLARLLTPADYGMAGMAFIFSGLATIFSDLALGGALVQRKEVTEEDRSTVFWGSLAFSFVVAGVCVALSPLVAQFFGKQEVQQLVAVMAISVPLSALTTTQVALLLRQLAYRSLEIRQMLAILAGAVAALAFAAAGFGPWAIVANSLVASAVSTLLVWRFSSWRPRFVFSFARLRDLSGFGLRLFGIRLMNYANLNFDNLLVGRFAGAAALGVYSLAYNVMFTPMIRIANPISSVVYPALARMQDDLPRMRRAWLRSKRLSASLLAPAFLIAIVAAPDLVPVLFGQRWHEAIPVIQLLAVAGVAHSLVTLNWTVLQGTGRMKVAFRLGILVSALTVASFAVGVRWGAVGVAAAYATIKLPVVLIDTYVTTRAVGFNFWEALRAGGSILPHALLAAAGAWLVRIALTDAGAPHVVALLAVVVTACLLYIVLLVVAAPGYVADARDVLGQRIPWLRRPLPAPIERHLARARTSSSDQRSSGWHGYRPTPLQEQLLLAALGDADSAAEAWTALPDTFDLDHLEPGSFELLPLAYRNLATALPHDSELPRLKGIYRRSWVKNNLLLGRIEEIGGTLRAAGIPALFLEGPIHAARFYGDLALRPTSTVHVLVREADSAEASTRLERRGWTPRPGSGAYPGWRLLFDTGGNICVLRSSLAFDYVNRGYEPAEEPLWRAAERHRVGETDVLVPSPTDALLESCVAGVRYGPLPPTQWLTDAVMILRTAELDWDRVIDLAVTHRQHLRLREALACLLDLPVPLPERVHAAHAWLAGQQPSRRERIAFELSSGRLARHGGLPHGLAELVAQTTGEPLVRTATRLPRHLCARWSVEHRWQLPLAAGRRMLQATRRT
ncbi:MAG TPA: oligosaccharide flippase family protein [Gaiellaceae bacterium]|nr:oligosaccharide flippase family protein [Gaiellaceae bacterium]